jgi:uncharacterized protein YajQ (UPF0234 family)
LPFISKFGTLLAYFYTEKVNMPSFDITSTVDMHEVTNAVDQANREVSTRFDFKNSGATFEQTEDKIQLKAQNTFQLQQMLTVLRSKLAKRDVDARALKIDAPEESLHESRQLVTIQQGIDQELAKKIIKTIKQSKHKVQATIQGDQIRVNGKNRDDLQAIITLLREEKISIPLQYVNFRD